MFTSSSKHSTHTQKHFEHFTLSFLTPWFKFSAVNQADTSMLRNMHAIVHISGQFFSPPRSSSLKSLSTTHNICLGVYRLNQHGALCVLLKFSYNFKCYPHARCEVQAIINSTGAVGINAPAVCLSVLS